MYTLNSMGDNLDPCRTPRSVGISVLPYISWLEEYSSYIRSTMLYSVELLTLLRSMPTSFARSTESKAFDISRRAISGFALVLRKDVASIAARSLVIFF